MTVVGQVCLVFLGTEEVYGLRCQVTEGNGPIAAEGSWHTEIEAAGMEKSCNSETRLDGQQRNEPSVDQGVESVTEAVEAETILYLSHAAGGQGMQLAEEYDCTEHLPL